MLQYKIHQLNLSEKSQITYYHEIELMLKLISYLKSLFLHKLFSTYE